MVKYPRNLFNVCLIHFIYRMVGTTCFECLWKIHGGTEQQRGADLDTSGITNPIL